MRRETKGYAIIETSDIYANGLSAGITVRQTDWLPLCTPGGK